MIVWLASYPRSGNTALRTILNRAFGINTYSLYDDKADIGSRRALREVVGHASHELDQQEFYARASAADDTYFVKTHDAPQDDAKAIYIVRDGRASVVSYFHYLKTFAAGQNCLTLKDVILGNCYFGSWSEHFAAWSPQTRPNTLLIHYDDIARNPARVVDAVSAFIGRQPRSLDLPNFKDLQKADSDFFRSGSDANNIAEMATDDLSLFWALHGQLMLSLGYVDSIPACPDLPQVLRQTFTDLGKRDQWPLRDALAASEADRAARLEVIHTRDATIATLQNDTARLQRELAESDTDRAAQSAIIERRGTTMSELQNEIEGLKARIAEFTAVQATVLGSRWWKIGRRLKLTPPLEPAPEKLKIFQSESPEVLAYHAASTARALEKIAERQLDIRTVIDVGASNGMWSAVTRKTYPDASYLLIEAQKVHEPELINYCRTTPKTEYVLAAAGDKIGSIYFDDSAPFGGVASHQETEAARTVVPVTTIDHEVSTRRLKGPFLIKLDTHGFEVPILQGATETLKQSNLVVIEVYNFKITDHSLLFDEMCAYMRTLGFGVIDISEPLWRQRDNAFWQMDLFFIPLDRPEFSVRTYT